MLGKEALFVLTNLSQLMAEKLEEPLYVDRSDRKTEIRTNK